MLITPEQIRAARALLRLDQARLARDAGISLITLRRLEGDGGLAKVAPATVDVVRRVLERAGAEFIDRGVRRGARTQEATDAARREIDRIVAQSAPLLARNEPLSDDELYDETGI
jgi:transcriptional regulator with XRE-family HTH domain